MARLAVMHLMEGLRVGVVAEADKTEGPES